MTGSVRGGVGWLLATAAAAATWAVVLALTIPRAITGAVGDYGFFSAVADRLAYGDALYTQVWDNKDPLVFMSLALARTGGVGGAWALEIAWVLLATVALFVIARRSTLTGWLSFVVAFVAAPFVVLGSAYFMGSTHLPGIALTLLALALMLSDRPMLAGIPVGVLLFFKFIMVPLALALVITVAVTRRRPRTLLRTAIGLLAATVAIALVLLARGELAGFISTQIDNILYSQSPIVTAEHTGIIRRIAQHIVILVNPSIVALEATALAVLAFTGITHMRRPADQRWAFLPVLWWTSAVAFVVAAVTIAVTGKWYHHAEIYAVAAALLLVLAAGSIRIELGRPTWIAVIVCALLVYPLAALPPIASYPAAVRAIPENWQSANEPDPLTVILQQQQPQRVAFVGWGNALPRSGGLGDWELACRHMAQRPFNPESMFAETLDCLPSAEMIVVGPDYGEDPAFPEYTEFVRATEALLAEHYDCRQDGDFRLCIRRDS